MSAKRLKDSALPEASPTALLASPLHADMLRNAVAGVSAATGEDFFRTLARYLAHTLEVAYVFFGELAGESRDRVAPICFCHGERFILADPYALAGTPCANVLRDGFSSYPRDVQHLFPDDRPLAAMGVHSYVGTALRANSGESLGVMVVMDTRPREDVQTAEWLLRIFALRASAELERRRAELALRQSEERFRSLAEATFEGVVIHERGRILEVNRGFARIVGADRAELIGRNAFEFIHPDYLALAKARVASDDQGAYEYVGLRADGTPVPIELRGRNFVYQGRPVRVVAVRDLTEQKQSAERIESSERELLAILSNMQDTYYRTDREGRLVRVSDAVVQLLGYAPAEVIGRNLADFYANPGDRALFLKRLADSGGVLRDNESCMRRKDGSIVWVSTNAQYCHDEHGHVVGVEGTTRDITKRRAAESALRESNTLLEQIFNNTHTLIAYLDRDFNFVRVNQAYAEADMRRPQSYIGKNHFDLHPDSDSYAIFHRVLETGEPHFAFAKPFIYAGHPERGVTYWDWSLSPVKDADGHVSGLVLVLVDVTPRVHAEHDRARSDALYRATVEQAPVGIAHVGFDGRWLKVNARLCEILGYSPDELLARTFADITHPDDIAEGWQRVRQLESGALDSYTREKRYLRHDGSTVWTMITASVMRDASGKPLFFISITEDITRRKAAEAEMLKLSQAMHQTGDAVVITDRQGVIEYVNQAFESVTGFTREEATGRKTNLLNSGFHNPQFYERLWRTILGGETFRDVFVNRKRNGDLFYEEKTITPITDAQGNITHFVSTGKDITERMQTQERLQYLAYHDVLTDLPNRVLLMDRLEHALSRVHWNRRQMAVLFLDLDRFKIINDTLGHDFGDKLLQALAQRLRSCVRESDTVARVSGDEFAILLEDLATADDIALVARKILEAFTRPFDVFGRELFVSASIGISVYPEDGGDAPSLLKNADTAMYRAKERGRNTYQFYSSDMSVKAVELLTLETGLRRALERQELVLHYQPQLDIRSGRIVGAEALLRWRHEQLGLVQPVDFIPLLEETGLVIPVGEWVLRTACTQGSEWNASRERPLKIAVNLSARQFNRPDLADQVEQMLRESRLDPERLEFEITETVLMQHAEATIRTLTRLSEIGCRFAIDDFGTGYSSLAYLKRFPISTLKIDQSFVRDIPGDVDDAAIVSSIIVMARSLKLEVIAEGVETEKQLAFLRAAGCNGVQGFLFNRPVPPAEFRHLLDAQK